MHAIPHPLISVPMPVYVIIQRRTSLLYVIIKRRTSLLSVVSKGGPHCLSLCMCGVVTQCLRVCMVYVYDVREWSIGSGDLLVEKTESRTTVHKGEH
jgi:hypothetical protein